MMGSKQFEGEYEHWLGGKTENPDWLLIVEENGFQHSPIAGSIGLFMNVHLICTCAIPDFDDYQNSKEELQKITDSNIDFSRDVKVILQTIINDDLVSLIFTNENEEWFYKKSNLSNELKEMGSDG